MAETPSPFLGTPSPFLLGEFMYGPHNEGHV